MIFIDLDNTIYNQKQILDYVFLEIGKYIEKRYDIPKNIIKEFLIKITKEKTLRYKIFDSLIEKFKLELDKKELLNLYKRKTEEYLINKKIKIYSDFEQILKNCNNFIIYTEGDEKIQKLKINNIEKNYKIKLDLIIVKNKLSEENIEIFKCYNPKIYIGDNPYTDFYIPNKLNIFTIRILRGLYKEIPDDIVSLEYRPKISIRRLNKNIIYEK